MGDIKPRLIEETELTKLPSLPHVLIKLLKACHQDTACFDLLSEIISKDASLSAKILSSANSPIYGKNFEFKSLKQTLVFLGVDVIKSITITAAVQQFFSSYSKEKSRFLRNYWEHSLYTANLAKSLATLTSYHSVEEAYLAGLLHDVGKLIFESQSNNDYSELINTGTTTNDILEAEQEKFSTTHDLIGAQLLEIWGLPDVITEAVKYHHILNSDITEAHHLVKIIHLASHISSNNNSDSEGLIEYGQTLFDLKESFLSDILNNAKTEVKKVSAAMEIDISNLESGEDNSEEKQILLAQEIRNISLTQGSMQPYTEDSDGIDYTALQKSNMILFGVDRSCLFLYEEERNILVLDNKTAQINTNILSNIEIKADSSSLIAETMNSCEVKTFFDNDKKSNQPVVDKQIVSALKTEGILCVPLIKSEQNIGVIVLGINKNQYQHIVDKTLLLEMYSTEITSRIYAAISGQKIRNDFIKNSQQQIKIKAREIIHEVNNPLAIIRNYLKILAGRLKENDPAQNDLSIISEEIDRVGNVILKCDEDIDSAVISTNIEKIDVNGLILSIHNIMESSLYATHGIDSILNMGKDIGFVYINKNSLKQILTNLIKNAVEAVKEKKEINIATRRVNVNGKEYLEIEIQDTGPGIDENILNNLYKPVTSTKGKHHSGLGLSIVKNLIDEMAGNITCKTSKIGTTFNLHFPLKNNK